MLFTRPDTPNNARSRGASISPCNTCSLDPPNSAMSRSKVKATTDKIWGFRHISGTAERICDKFTRRRVWSLARMSLKVNVKGQGHQGQKTGLLEDISGMTEWICTKFTRKTCFVPHSDEFEGQGEFQWPACDLCLEKHLCSSFVCVWNITGTAKWICAEFTWKTYLVPHSDEFEGQGQRSRSPGTAFFGPFDGLHVVYVW